ncbi:MAG TPA: DUF1844 domain-containing protein [Pyrinomonadaceae bacterium]|nr:DUF1844 domain-containing protein [Pyrinomonadaceae bacterium]
MSEEQPVFKVTDRRLFNPDGTPREVEREEPAAAPAQAEPPAASQEPTAAAPAEAARPDAEHEGAAAPTAEDIPEDDYADDPTSFVGHVMFIATQAAASLGMLRHPETGQAEVDLQFAKHWIDVLGTLQEKTRGNLDERERRILEGWLGDLRMQYVAMSGKARPAAPRGFTGRDIIGGK